MKKIIYTLILCIPLVVGCEKEQEEMTPDFLRLTQNDWYIHTVVSISGIPMDVNICEKGQYRNYKTDNTFSNVQEVQYCDEGHYSGSFQLNDKDLSIFIDGTEYTREIIELDDRTLVYKDRQLIYTYTIEP